MKIKAELCFGGNNRYQFRITMRSGAREFITVDEGEGWSRRVASQALDLLEGVYGFKRKNIRFI